MVLVVTTNVLGTYVSSYTMISHTQLPAETLHPVADLLSTICGHVCTSDQIRSVLSSPMVHFSKLSTSGKYLPGQRPGHGQGRAMKPIQSETQVNQETTEKEQWVPMSSPRFSCRVRSVYFMLL